MLNPALQRDVLMVGTQTSLMVYDVEASRRVWSGAWAVSRDVSHRSGPQVPVNCPGGSAMGVSSFPLEGYRTIACASRSGHRSLLVHPGRQQKRHVLGVDLRLRQ